MLLRDVDDEDDDEEDDEDDDDNDEDDDDPATRRSSTTSLLPPVVVAVVGTVAVVGFGVGISGEKVIVEKISSLTPPTPPLERSAAVAAAVVVVAFGKWSPISGLALATFPPATPLLRPTRGSPLTHSAAFFLSGLLLLLLLLALPEGTVING